MTKKNIQITSTHKVLLLLITCFFISPSLSALVYTGKRKTKPAVPVATLKVETSVKTPETPKAILPESKIEQPIQKTTEEIDTLQKTIATLQQTISSLEQENKTYKQLLERIESQLIEVKNTVEQQGTTINTLASSTITSIPTKQITTKPTLKELPKSFKAKTGTVAKTIQTEGTQAIKETAGAVVGAIKTKGIEVKDKTIGTIKTKKQEAYERSEARRAQEKAAKEAR